MVHLDGQNKGRNAKSLVLKYLLNVLVPNLKKIIYKINMKTK